MKQENEYKGHQKNSGGLQGHSLGALYPITVIGVGTRGEYQYLDCRNGNTGPRCATYQEAASGIDSYNFIYNRLFLIRGY
jgi:hypothetical protein